MRDAPRAARRADAGRAAEEFLIWRLTVAVAAATISNAQCAWGRSSAGRALPSQGRGRGFESPRLHQVCSGPPFWAALFHARPGHVAAGARDLGFTCVRPGRGERRPGGLRPGGRMSVWGVGRGARPRSRDTKTVPCGAIMNPPLRRWVSPSRVPAFPTTGNLRTEHEISDSQVTLVGSPSLPAGERHLNYR